MKYRVVFGLITLLTGAMMASTAGASPAYQNAGEWRNYPTPAQVTALAAKGDMVWAGTPAGLIRFNQSDGTSVTYTTADGLTSNDISAVAINPDGRPWVGAWDGNISYFDGQAWQAIRLLEAPEDGVYLSAITFDDLGQVWYGVYGYGVHGQGQDFTSADGLSESYVMAMAISGQEVWVGTRLSLSRYDGQNWRNFTPKDGLTGPGVTAVAIDPLGQVWAGTYESGLNRFDGQNWTGFTTADGLPDNYIKAIAIDAAGQPWVATPKGAARFDGQQWTAYTSADGLADDNVKAITVDDDGHLWFGTTAGLTEFIPPAATADTPLNEPDFITYTTADGLPGDKIWDIAFDAGGRAWVGVYEGGTGFFDGQSWTTYTAGQGFFDPQKNRFIPTDDGLADADVQAILPMFDGRVWFGTEGGVSLLDKQLWRHYTYADDGLAANTIESLTVDRTGHIWATHLAAGVSRFDGQSWTIYTADDGLVDDWVHAAAVDRDGRLWFGTNGGVSRFDGQSWTTYTTADGLADNIVFAVAVTPNGQQWFGTSGGLSQFDGQSWTTHLAGRAIQDVAVAPNGDLWAVGSGRVSRLVLPETGEPGEANWVDYLPGHFAAQDLRTVAVDPAGRVWVGSFGAGITIFNPDESFTFRRVWFGTPAGVSVFDGQNWQNYTTLDGLVDNQVRAIAIDPQGRKWFGTANGVSLFEGQQWTSYPPLTTSLVSNFVQTVAVDPANRLWFGYGERGQGVTVLALSEAEGGGRPGWITYTTADGLADNYVYAIAIAPDGSAWIGTAAGASRFDGQSWTTYTTADGLLTDTIRAIAIAPDSSAWVGTVAGVSRFDGQQWRNYTAADGLVAGQVNAIAVDPQGQVWVGAEPVSRGNPSGGVSRFDGEQWFTYPATHDNSGTDGASNGLLGDWVTTIALDSAGRPWLGLLNHPLAKPLWVNGGVNHFDDQQWLAYTADSGLVSDEVTAVTIDRNGHRWIGTRSGISKFDGQSWTTYTTANDLPHNEIRSLAVDAVGRVWAATWGGGVSYFDGRQWTTYTTTGLADKQVNAIAIDHEGHPWFATPGGVSRFDGQHWTAYTTLDGLVDNYAKTIVVDAGGHIWVGTGRGEYQGGGVSRFDGQSWTGYTTASGLPRNNVDALAVDGEGNVWAASSNPGQYTPQTGLSKFDGQQWLSVQAGALADDRVYSLAIDQLGQPWFGTDGSYNSGGLVHFDGQNWRSYSQSDGLAGSGVYAVAIDPTGAKWLGTDKGVSVFDGQTWQTFTGVDGLADDMVLAVAVETVDLADAWQSVIPNADDQFTRLAAAPDGPVWAVDSTHLVQVEGQTPRRFDLPAGLREKIAANPSRAFPTITDLAAATDGTVWISTKTDLYHFAGGNWRHFTPADGLPAEAVLRTAVDAQNQLWAIFGEGEGYLLSHFDGQQWQPSLLPDIAVAPTGLAVMPGGEVWLSVPGRAPFRFDGSRWTQPVEGWNAGLWDMFLAAGPAGGVWFGSDNGWQRWTSHNWQELEVTIPAPFSYPAAVDANGGAWGIVTGFCYWCKQPNLNEYGAVYVTPEQSCRFTAADGGLGGPPLDPPLARPDAVWDIAIGADGRVWFIAQGKIIVFSPQRAVCDYAAPENVRIVE